MPLPLVHHGSVEGVEAETEVAVKVSRGRALELPHLTELGLAGGVRGCNDKDSEHPQQLAEVLAARRSPVPGHQTVADEAGDHMVSPCHPGGQGGGQVHPV